MSALEAALSVVVYDGAIDNTTVAKCRGLMRGYHARWKDSTPWRPLSVEGSFEPPKLYNPDTGRPSRMFRLGGKLDVTAETDEGERAIVDHKTASDDIGAPDAPYWDQLAIEGQVSHYHLLEWLQGRKCDIAIWDVVRKPSISPRKVSKADAASVVGEGSYCGDPITEDDLTEMSRTGRETPAMYEARLVHDCTDVRPEWYFQRRRIPRLDADLLEYARDLWGHAKDIMAARRSGRHPKNPGACFYKNSPCLFLGVCSGRDTVDSDKWRRKTQVHSELELPGDGRDVLTTSRIHCWQLCRHKHHLKYDLGIERNTDEPESAALYFGSAWHAVQEAYFKALMSAEKGTT